MTAEEENNKLHQLIIDALEILNDYKRQHGLFYRQKVGTLTGEYERLKMVITANKIEQHANKL
jgi:hypothetical protein